MLSDSELCELRNAYDYGYNIAFQTGCMFCFYVDKNNFVYRYNRAISRRYNIPFGREINLRKLFGERAEPHT